MLFAILISLFAFQAASDVNPEAIEYFRNGEALIGTPQEYSDAQEEWFRKAVEAAPEFVPARQNLALVMLKRGKLDDALVQLEEVVRLDPKNVNARLLRADVWVQKHDLEKAGLELAALLELEPKRGDLLEQLGDIRLEQKRYPEAIDLLQKAGAGGQATPEVDFNLAVALQNAGRKPEALEAYLRFLTKSPDDFQGNFFTGLLYIDIGDKEAALKYLLKACSVNPTDRGAAEELGNLYLDLGKPREAQRYLEHADQGAVVNAANLGVALRQQKRYPEAEKQFRAALEKEPRNVELWQNLGDVLLLEEKDEAAAEAYKQALLLKPDDFDTLFNLGSVYANINQPDEAQRYFERAVKLDPRSGRAHFYLGLVLDRQNQGTAARNHYLAALENGTDEAQAHFRLGILFSRDGLVDQALKELRIAFERDAKRYVPLVRDELKNVHSDLDAVRYTAAFNELLARYESVK